MRNKFIRRFALLLFSILIPVATAAAQSPLHHRQVEVNSIPIHVVEGGEAESPAVLFLHGWPENWAQFKEIMIPLSKEAHVVALDLPGIGRSTVPAPSAEKRVLAKYVRGVVEKLDLQEVILAAMTSAATSSTHTCTPIQTSSVVP